MLGVAVDGEVVVGGAVAVGDADAGAVWVPPGAAVATVGVAAGEGGGDVAVALGPAGSLPPVGAGEALELGDELGPLAGRTGLEGVPMTIDWIWAW